MPPQEKERCQTPFPTVGDRFPANVGAAAAAARLFPEDIEETDDRKLVEARP